MSQTLELNNSNTRLFVSGLYEGIDDKTIRNHFEPFGTITDLYILRNQKKKSRGCCFIGFLNKLQASNALKQCNKTYIGTRRIIVKFAFDKTQKHKPTQNKKQIASSSNFNSNSNSNSNLKHRPKDNKKDKEYQQFLRLAKSAANVTKSTDEDSSDDSDCDVMDDSKDSNVKQVKDHNIAIKHDIDNADNDGKTRIIENKKVTEIFIRNLPFITSDSDLFKFFNEFGNILQVFIPLDDFGKGKGYGFVEFESNECIQKIFEKYQGTLTKNETNRSVSCIFNGRNINILLSNYKYKETYCIDGKEICYNDLDDELKSNLSFKQLKYLKLKHSATDQKTWNTLFIPTDNILRYNASKLNVTKSDLLGISDENNKNNMAVTTTLAETSVISKTKSFLSQNGIDVNKFNEDKKVTVRSMNIILVKNFPFNTGENELKSAFKKYGEIARFLLPETKACAIVEFMNVKDAQNAFHDLSYSKFKHLPLFLEWAPINLFDAEYAAKKENGNEAVTKEQEDESKEKRKKRKKRKLSDMDDSKTKVIVKNIPFETNKKELLKLFGVYGKIKSLRLPRKYGGGHRGFCFVEFDTNKEALNVFDALSSSHFYGRHLVIQWAQNDTTDAKKTRIE